ncbi:MAG: HAMP domain-containing histidine kinase [Bifidobacteriaceae bacterium]|nr:HAMP domain-containing histidine kinase [Bifidobacteriaceae bacterium]
MKHLLTVYPAWEPTLSALVRNLAVVMTVGSVTMSVVNGLLMLGPWAVLINLAIPVFILFAIMRIRRTGQFSGPFMVMIIGIFLVMFPVAFFAVGGIQGPVPYYFFIGVAITALMLQGLQLYLALALELSLFVGCMVFALTHPWAMPDLPPDRLAMSMPICMLTILIEIALVVHSVYRFYLRTALELESSNERLRDTAKNKDAFLALIAHELKTPMAIMSSHAQEALRALSAAPHLSPELSLVQRDAEIMMNQAESLSDMVTQLLDFSRINDGHMVLSLRPIALSEVVQSTMAECVPICAVNHNRLQMARGGAYPQVMGDAARLSRALVNLIANATRHTHNGAITISLTKEGTFARVAVEDTGEGMSPEAVAAAMSGDGATAASYAQVDDESESESGTTVSLPVPVAAGSRHGGLGLGLRIVRHIVEAHGGAFSLESELGKGTRTTFTVPLAN